MVFIRFEGFILALLLVSIALQSVHVDGVLHQERRPLEANLLKETQENDASLNKELVTATSGIGSGSNKDVRIGGRKMGMMLKKEDEEIDSRSRSRTGDAQKLNVEADKNASEEGPQDFLNNQGQDKTTLETTKGKMISHDDQSDEWKKILEEADKKVMQMMKRDYGGMKKPRRKPPINNHEPGN